MLPKDAGVFGDEEGQEGQAERRVAHADFFEFLGTAGLNRQKRYEK